MKLAHTLAVVPLALGVAHAQTSGSFVMSGVGCPSLGLDPQSNINAEDDALSTNHALGFVFPFAGGSGSTSAIDIAPNGYVYLEAGTNLFDRCCNGAAFGAPIADFFAATPSIACFGQDLNASPTTGGGSVHFHTNNVDEATISWSGVREFPNTGSNTLQCTLFRDGMIRISFNSCALATHQGLVGYSPGGGAIDAGGVDFSAATSANPNPGEAFYETFVPGSFDLNGTSIDFVPDGSGSYFVRQGPAVPVVVQPLTIDSADRPTIGQTANIEFSNIPSNAVSTTLLLGSSNLGGIGLDPIGMEGCTLWSSADVAALPVASNTFPFVIPNSAGLSGIVFEMQGASIAPGANTLGVTLSNLGTMTIGDTSPVVVECNGSNTFNSTTSSGFWRVTNGSLLDIVGLQLDFTMSSNPAQSTNEFDTNQTGMADRPDGGNSTSAGCRGTYRLGSDLTVGLDYAASIVSPCDPLARTGWVGTNAGGSNGDWRTIDFAFTSFSTGDVFEFDFDTDGGPGVSGDAMAGLVVTVTLSNGTVLSGEIVAIGLDMGRLEL